MNYEEQLENELVSLRKPFPRYLKDDFATVFSLAGVSKEDRKKDGAFSFPEVIDKFLIIAVKQEYIRDDNLKIKNSTDYDFLFQEVTRGFALRSITETKRLDKLLNELWRVNVEIFILNDVCRSNENDHIVAEGSRKMVEMMKKRSQLKHKIGLETGDVVHEVKQYGL